METKQIIKAINLGNSEIFMTELYRKLDMLRESQVKIQSFNGKSERQYWIIEQIQWGKNDTSLTISHCDGFGHQLDRMSNEYLRNTIDGHYRYAINTEYCENNKGSNYLEIEVSRIQIAKATRYGSDNPLVIQKSRVYETIKSI